MARLAEEAPGLEVACRSTDRLRALDMLDADEINLALGVLPTGEHRHKRRVLHEDGYLCLYDPQRVATARPIGLETYLAHAHVLVSLREDRTGRVDEALRAVDRSRRVALSVARFGGVPHVMREAALIATLPRHLAERYAAAQGLADDPVPLDLPTFPVAMLWHASRDRDPAHRWLRDTVAALAARTGGGR